MVRKRSASAKRKIGTRGEKPVSARRIESRGDEERFRTVFEKSSDGLLIADAETKRFLDANHKICEMLGYGRDELLELGVRDIHPEEALPDVIACFEKQLAGEITVARDLPVKRKDASVFRADINSCHITLDGRRCMLGSFRDITERIRAEEKLLKSKDLLDATGRMARVGGWEVDAETLEVRWTEETYRIHEIPLGKEPPLEEAIDFFHPDDRERLSRAIRRALEHGEPYDMELRFVTAKGKRLWTRMVCEPHVVDGKTVKLMGTFQDITDRKKAERALVASETCYRRLFEAAQDGILILDADNGIIMEANPFIEDILGYSPGELIGRPLWEIGALKDIAASRLALAELQRNEYIRYENLPLSRKDGRLVEVEFVSNVYLADSRKVIQCNIRDITERRRAEKEFRAAKSFLDTVVDMSPFAMWISDRKGTLIRTNRSLRETLHLTDEQILGRYNVLEDGNLEKEGVMDLVKAVFEKHEPARFSIPWKAADAGIVDLEGGRALYIDVSMFPMLDDDGNLTNVVCQWVDITKRTRAEKELTRQKAFIDSAVNSLPGIFFVISEEMRILRWNRNFETVSGYSADTIATMSPLELFEEPDRTLVEGRMNEAFERGSFSVEARLITKDGKRISFFFTGARVRLQGQTCITGMGTDLTDIEEAQEALRRSKERLSAALDAAELGTWDWDLASGEIVWGGHHARLFGYGPGEFDGKYETFEERIHQEDRESVREAVNRSLREGTEYHCDFRVVWPDGTTRWIAGSGSFRRNEKGEAVRMLGVVYDITEEKVAEEAILEKAFMIESASAIIGTADLDGRMTYANSAFLASWGFKRLDEFLGRQFTDFWVLGDRYEEVMAALLGAGAPGRWSGELKGKRKDGSLFDLYVSAATVYDSLGRPSGLMSTSIDITERKKIEEQLRHIQKMEAVGTLSGGLAHDFNNILAGIIGYTSLLKKTLKESPVVPDLEAIERLTWRGADLTERLLTFSRKGKPEARAQDINPLVEDVLKVIGRTAGSHLAIKAEQAPETLVVYANTGQLHQAVMNLCINACEAMPEEGVLTVTTGRAQPGESFFETHPALKRGRYIRLAVSDTGEGMDAATRERIFEPFFTTKAEKSGTGLGLSMVMRIVENHGGCIDVESEEGKGSTFSVYLPAAESEAAVEEPPPAGPLRGDETILMVDDEEYFRRSVGRWLEELGYGVIQASGGEEAVRLLEEKKDGIDIVLLDMVMRGMSGSDTVSRMREIAPELPIVICTGFALQSATRKLLEKDVDDFIRKPFDIEEIADKIRGVLDGGRSASQTRDSLHRAVQSEDDTGGREDA